MREISNDEMGKIVGGVKSPRGIGKHPDDDDIKLHPAPSPRDGDPRIPTDPGRMPSGNGSDTATASPLQALSRQMKNAVFRWQRSPAR